MRCVACNRRLSDKEATYQFEGEYQDMCFLCLGRGSADLDEDNEDKGELHEEGEVHTP